MLAFSRQDERQTIIADAASIDLLAMVDCIWEHLPNEERRRRMAIADQLHRRPDPWWKNLRAEAQPDFSCKNSSG
jgi:hypothetical protein